MSRRIPGEIRIHYWRILALDRGLENGGNIFGALMGTS